MLLAPDGNARHLSSGVPRIAAPKQLSKSPRLANISSRVPSTCPTSKPHRLPAQDHASPESLSVFLPIARNAPRSHSGGQEHGSAASGYFPPYPQPRKATVWRPEAPTDYFTGSPTQELPFAAPNSRPAPHRARLRRHGPPQIETRRIIDFLQLPTLLPLPTRPP
jgi:hypothetical protein